MKFIQRKKRFDTILIWSHGVKYIDAILNIIRADDDFEIVRVIKHRPANMKRFVRKVYSYDYAPLNHLKAKIKYLERMDPCLYCVVVNNKEPIVDIMGVGSFRHEESLSLKKLKTIIREKYNPYFNGEMSHDHVVHATDNEEQTKHILDIVGDISIEELYRVNFLGAPAFLGNISEYKIKEIDFNSILCSQVKGPSDNFSIVNTSVENSIQYLAISDRGDEYKKYIRAYLGTALKCDYNIDKYFSMAKRFKYLTTNYETSYVFVKEINHNDFLIVDGLHRASLHLHQGNKKIIACIIK